MKKQVSASIQTKWNLQLLYTSPKDPHIEQDLVAMERVCASFAKKWKRKDLSIRKNLLRALADYEAMEEVLAGSKPIMYFYFAREIDTSNQKLSGIINKLEERFNASINETLFFHLTIGKFSKKEQQSILHDPQLSRYRYMLERIFLSAHHQRTEAEEKIIILKSSPAYAQWITATEKGIGQLSVSWKGESLSLTKTFGLIQTLRKQPDRKRLHGLITTQLQSLALIAESEMNAIITNKKIDDGLRGFSEPYEATLLDYHNTATEIFPMIDAVKKSYKLVHRLFSLKKKLLKYEHLGAYDMSMQLAYKQREYSFEEAVTIIRSAFEKVHPEYREIFDQYLTQGQIDVYPRHGKRGGGYCAGDYGRPTYILLNWNNTADAVATLAHEMGHAIHAEYSNRHQGVLYHDHPISTAEVASTLFENFVRDEIRSTLNEKERIYEQFNYLQDVFMTIHRQVNHFEFEREIYRQVYRDGAITAEDITKIRSKFLQEYMGPSATIVVEDGWSWITHSHIRRFFYTYSYAYGQMISTALYHQYQKDPAYIEKINQFLCSGGCATPEHIFKSIGIDTTRTDFWQNSVSMIGQQLSELERSCKQMKLI